MNQQEQAAKTFTDYALEKMLDLFHNHDHEVGSQLKKAEPEEYKEYQSTDCITYVLNVLSHAFREMGDEQSADRTWQLGAHGTKLAKYLVEKHNWKGTYTNPDSMHPRDAIAGNTRRSEEHTYSSIIALKKHTYYDIPLKYAVQNYCVTPENYESFQLLNKNKPVTQHNEIDIASLEQVAFGFGVSRGGMHTWLFSKGKIYEVHWNSIGDGLYEATPIRIFPWLSGALVIPPEQACHLAPTAKIK